VACGEASSSVVSSVSSTPAGSVSSPVSSFANVTSITISAASNTLKQLVGATQKVTVAAAINPGVNPSTLLEWYVNDEISNQNGRVFEFVPTKDGIFKIKAKSGSTVSNELTVTVNLNTITFGTPEFVGNKQILVEGTRGAQVTLAGTGVTMAKTSYYNLEEGQYVIDLTTALVQGTEVSITLSRDGFAPVTKKVTYDTRVLDVETLKLDGVDVVKDANGVFQITKPFDETYFTTDTISAVPSGSATKKTYVITVEQEDLLGATSIPFSQEHTVPTGADPILPTTSLVLSSLGTSSFDVDVDSVPGLYVHKYTLGAKTLEVKVQINEPQPEIVLSKHLVPTWDVGLEEEVKFDFAYGLNGALVGVVPNAAGEYEIVKPFTSFEGITHELNFAFIAKNFENPEFVSNRWTVSLKGPTKFSTNQSVLFTGFERFDTADTTNSTNMQSYSLNSAFTGTALNAAATGHSELIVQTIDSGTPAGRYVFTITAGSPGNDQLIKEVVVVVKNPEARLDLIVDSFESVNAGSITRIHNVNEFGVDSYVIEKPSIADAKFEFSWYAVLANYQSTLETDFAKISQNSVITKLSDKTLFGSSSGVKVEDPNTANNSPAAHAYISKAAVANTIIFDYPIPANAASFTISGTASSGNIVSVLSTVLTIPAGATSISLGTITPGANVALTDKVTYTIQFKTSAPANIGDPITYIVGVSDYPDVIQMGGKWFGGVARTGSGTTAEFASSDFYNFINLSMSVVDPSNSIPRITDTRLALLLDYGRDSVVLFNQTGAGIKDTATDDYLLDASGGAGNAAGLGAASITGDSPYNDVARANQVALLTNSGLFRKPLVIDRNTVSGNYSFTFRVDNVVKTLRLQVVEAQPKVFVLSGFNTADPALKTSANEGSFSTSGEDYNLLKVFNNSGDNASGHTAAAADKFVAPDADGVYEVLKPSTLTAKDMLYAQIAVTDLPAGEYRYTVIKKYPDGRIEDTTDLVTVSSLDLNQRAVFAANAKFEAAWIINEATYALGLYEFTFTINGITREVFINVVDQPALKINSLTVGGVEAVLFNAKYRVTAATLAANKEIKATFGLTNLTEDQFFTVTIGGTDNADLNLPTALLPTAGSAANTRTSGFIAIKDLELIDLAKVITAANASEVYTFTFSFYNKVPKLTSGASGFSAKIGEDQVITLQVLA
jgi:hypothetical protein